MDQFWKHLGQGISQGGQQVAQGMQQQAQFDMQKELQTQLEQQRQQREDDRQAYESLQQMNSQIMKLAGHKDIAGTPLGDQLLSAAEQLSTQPITGASQMLQQINSGELFGGGAAGQAASQAMGQLGGAQGPSGRDQRPTGAPLGQQAQAAGQAPSGGSQGPAGSLPEAMAQGQALLQQVEENDQWRDVSLDSALGFLSSGTVSDDVKRSFAAGYLEAAGDQVPGPLQGVFQAFMTTRGEDVTADQLNTMSPQEIATRYGTFINSDGSLKEGAPEILNRYSGDLAGVAKQGQFEISIANDMQQLGLTDAQTNVQRNLVGLKDDQFNLKQAPKEAQRAQERHYMDMRIGGAQADQLEQSVKHAGIRFDEEQRDRLFARLQSAADTGFDGHLNTDEKVALANYLGTEYSPDEGSAYKTELGRIAQENQEQASALRARASIDNRATETGIEVQEQQMSMNDYAMARTRLTDQRADGTLAWQAARNGDVGVLDNYIQYLENPEAFPEQSAALEQAGVTLDTLRGYREDAQTVFDNDRTRDSLQTQLVQAELQGALQAQGLELMDAGTRVAQHFESKEDFEEFLTRNPGVQRQLGDEGIASARAAVGMKETQKGREDAYREYQLLIQNRPTTQRQKDAAVIGIENSLQEMGVSESVARGVGEGFRSAWDREATQEEMDILTGRANLAMLQAQAFSMREGVTLRRGELAVSQGRLAEDQRSNQARESLEERRVEEAEATGKANRRNLRLQGDQAEAEIAALEATGGVDPEAVIDAANDATANAEAQSRNIARKMESCFIGSVEEGIATRTFSPELSQAGQDNCSNWLNQYDEVQSNMRGYEQVISDVGGLTGLTGGANTGGAGGNTGGGSGGSTGTPRVGADTGQGFALSSGAVAPYGAVDAVTSDLNSGMSESQIRSQLGNEGYNSTEINDLLRIARQALE